MENNFVNRTFGNPNPNPNQLKISDTDIAQVGYYVIVSIDNIKEEYRDDMYADDGNVWFDAQEYFIDYLIDPYDYYYTDWDEFEWNDFVRNLINEYPYYLVYARACTWDGRSGADVQDNIYGCFKRSYDVCQYVTGSNEDGSALSISESSHDCSMGYTVLIVGIDEATQRFIEYEAENPFEEIKSICETAEKTLTDVE